MTTRLTIEEIAEAFINGQRDLARHEILTDETKISVCKKIMDVAECLRGQGIQHYLQFRSFVSNW